MIDSRLLTLRTFAACGTVAATAELTGYSPSAVSAQLRELQKSLGMQLVTKDGRGLRLTLTGRRLVEGAEVLLAQWEELKASALKAGEQIPAHLGLGGFSTAASQLLAPLAARLRSQRPDLELQLIDADPERCYRLLLAERIDLAVVVSMQSAAHGEDDPQFEHVHLLDDPLDVVVPATHPLADRGAVGLEELASDAWITDVPGSTYRALFTAAFAAVGHTPRVAHESTEWETMTAFVSAGMGVGFLPRLAPMSAEKDLVRLRLSGASRPMRGIVAVVRRGSLESPLLRESIEILQDSAHQILIGRME